MPSEDKFKDLFNNPNLENEDWLEPGPELLSALTEELYPEENKNRKYLFLFLFSFLTLALLLFLLFKSSILGTNQTTPNTFIGSSETVQKSETKSTEEIFSAEENQVIESNIVAAPTTKKKDNNKLVSQKNKQSNALTKKTKVQSSSVFYTQKKQAYTSVNDDIAPTKMKTSSTANNKLKVPSDFNNTIEDKLTTTLLPSNILPLLDGISIEAFNFNRATKEINTDDFLSHMIDLRKEEHGFAAFEISAGITGARFILNDNYSSDLNPFDFSHEEARGYFVSLTGSKSISEKFNMKLISTYEEFNMYSGHNSEVSYFVDEETTENTSIRELGMATPLGFINSEIVIARVADNVENQTNLIIDLHNKHTVRLIELSGVGEYELISKNRINLKPSIGFGASYIVEIENDLDAFETNHSSFTSSTSKITANQSSINRLTPFLDLGFSFDYKLRRGLSLGAIYRYKKNLQPVFQQADYNSTMNRQNLGLYLRFDL